jgi:hypothetical protein
LLPLVARGWRELHLRADLLALVLVEPTRTVGGSQTAEAFVVFAVMAYTQLALFGQYIVEYTI